MILFFKKIILSTLVIFPFVVSAAPVPINPYDITYSGAAASTVSYNTDTLLSAVGGTDIGSADAINEAKFVADSLGSTDTFTSFKKSDDSSEPIVFDLYQTATQFVVAIDPALTFDSGYYVAKFGKYSLALKNEVDLHNLVFDLTWLPLNNPQNAFLGLSHFDLIDGPSISEIPLPAAAWLFGSAFAGLMGFSRKRTRVA